ncbi:hypothetical protein FC07_GL003002 [Loigolactobacillus bifermentans DSM 20003]|uniref:FeoB-associated Cys-rich membrane protein n=2 Tax=Loigolactobacillus bifermentans TaxID=1607 RepID=A0A0R1H2A2_9LACO|nr:hypothetical protein FC07_GL003002 [Loigolactobacillus bifermentans DSM 20003]
MIVMSILINLIIAAVIIAFAGWQIVKLAKRSKHGKCAACDYKCEAKKMMVEAEKRPH